MSFFGFHLFGNLWGSWIWASVSFLRLEKFSDIISLNIIFVSFGLLVHCSSVWDMPMILDCAHMVERMYSNIAAQDEEFIVSTLLMVAWYVMEVQNITHMWQWKAYCKKAFTSSWTCVLNGCSVPACLTAVRSDL